MIVIFVHGWSVTSTKTYGGLPEALLAEADAGLDLDVRHVHLGKYISFHDEVRVCDIARAFEAAIREQIPHNEGGDTPFSCITHSTGGPVVRAWLDMYYGAERLAQAPLRHLVMLAPANHGSALARLGKEVVGRIKAWFQGVQPGKGVLEWLELGSSEQLALNLGYLDYRPATDGAFYPFVLVGQTIDRKLYDHVNSYTGEPGSDGVVRVAAANLNFRYVRLEQRVDVARQRPRMETLAVAGKVRTAPETAFGVVPKASHSGERFGIMRSVTTANTPEKPVVGEILRCLAVQTAEDYALRQQEMAALTGSTQSMETVAKYSMIVWRVTDDSGLPVTDFDILILAGEKYDPDALPAGFFQNRQKNSLNANVLTYFVDHDLMAGIRDGKIGFRVVARPDEGFSWYSPCEFRSGDLPLSSLLRPNETLIVDIVLHRHVDRETFRLDGATQKGVLPRESFRRVGTSGVDVSAGTAQP